MILTRKRRLETTPQPQERQSQWTTKIGIVDDIDDDGRRRRRRLRMCDDDDDETKMFTRGDNDDDDDVGSGDPETQESTRATQ